MAVPLRTRRWGGGDRRVLLLHGITGGADGWWRLGPDLADRGWAVIAPDLRGHGQSPPAGDYRLRSQADDVLALGGGWDAVLGHSMGGAIAVLAQTADPGFAGRLILQDPALLLGAVPVEETLKWLLEPYGRPMTVEAFAAENPTYHPEDVRLKVELLAQCPADVVEAIVRQNPDWVLLEETASLEVPTTIIGGDPAHGGILPVTIGEWFASMNELVEYRMLAGSGHSAHREPAVYERFLDAVSAAMEVET